MTTKLNVKLLREFKQKHYLTRAWFVDKLGVSDSTINHMFSEGHIPLDSTLTKLAKLMKINVDELILIRKREPK
jgi:transcriptional regulator with XRE-family HTH domain